MATSSPSLGSLPEELLVQILDYSSWNEDRVQDGVTYTTRVHSELRSLCLVSRQFHRLATPFLFEEITFWRNLREDFDVPDYSIVPPCRRAIALHRLLQDNPPLRSMCFALDLVIDDEEELTDKDFRVANDLLSWLGRTRSFRMIGGFHNDLAPYTDGTEDEDEMEFIKQWTEELVNLRRNVLGLISTASQSMTDLKDFQLNNVGGDCFKGPSLAEAMECINFSSLETLTLCGCQPSDPSYLSRVLSSKDPHTAPFTILTLKYCRDTAEAMEKFIAWPKGLVDFTINTSGNRLVGDVSLEDAQRWLSSHSDSLEKVYIDLLGHDQGLKNFDISEFPSLESVMLSRTQLNYQDDDLQNDLRWESFHSNRLLPSSLKTFGMSFGILGCCLINNFGEKEVNWLRQLGQAAASPKSNLQTIEILFNPQSAYPHKFGNYPNDQSYPWDRMSELSGELAKCGINLVYDPPPWTKKEWEGKIARWRGKKCSDSHGEI